MPAPSERPNILWICSDQQRWDTLSCYGSVGAATPHLDQLAHRGVAFSRAYCQSPVCTPSRASFLTGLYPINHQVHRNGNTHFPRHLELLPRMLRNAGYRTGLVGKLHLSRAQGIVEDRPDDGYESFCWSQHPDPDWEIGHDYQDWLRDKGVDPIALYADQKGAVRSGVPETLSQTAWAGERAASFVSEHRSTPWFLSINLFDPHPPFDPPASYLARFDQRAMPEPLFRESDLAHQARFLTRVDQQARVAVDPRHMEGDDDRLVHRPIDHADHDHDRPPTQFSGRALRASYHAMVAQIDDMVGRLYQTLEATGQAARTLIIFCSDHGEMLGDHGLLYKGCRFYEGLVHVPLLISWPEARNGPGLKADALVELVDLAPTILDATGIDVPAWMQGRSLMPIVRAQQDPTHHKDYVLAEYFDSLGFEGSAGSRASMYFDGRYKLSVYHDADLGELFDHAQDGGEFEDLWDAPGHAHIRAELLRKHFNAMMCASGAGPRRSADY